MTTLPLLTAKKKVTATQHNPLPIPLKGFGCIPHDPWPVYEARLVGGEVVVTDPQHMEALYQNGYFGTGYLSNKGLDHESFSKKMTEQQMSRKLHWRSIVPSRQVPRRHALIKFNDTQSPKSKTINNTKSANNSTHLQSAQVFEIPKKYVYVIADDVDILDEDSGEEEENEHRMEENKQMGDEQPLVVDSNGLCLDKYPIEEELILSQEEAIFLSFGLGCLLVKDERGEPLSIDVLWRKFIEEEPDLPYLYAVYHHFRSEGWVVRSGAPYNADYLLYAVGPDYYHAQFSVVVEGWQASEGGEGEPLTQPRLHWEGMNLLDKLATNVHKMAVACLVLRPFSMSSVSSMSSSASPDPMASVEACVRGLRVEAMPFTWQDIDKEDNEDTDD